MKIFAFHGFYLEEQIVGAWYTINVQLNADISQAAKTDLLQNTINYETIYLIVKNEMNIVSSLLEHVLWRIIKRIKFQFENVSSVKVRIEKHNPAFGGILDSVFIEDKG